jgi:hypothetical protein
MKFGILLLILGVGLAGAGAYGVLLVEGRAAEEASAGAADTGPPPWDGKSPIQLFLDKNTREVKPLQPYYAGVAGCGLVIGVCGLILAVRAKKKSTADSVID